MSDQLIKPSLHSPPAGYELLDWTRGFGRQIGPLFERRDADGVLVRAFRVEEHHTNGMQNAHGGMLMSFADMAWGGAVERDDDTWWVTVRLLCDFLAGAPLGSLVEGKGVVAGRQDDLFTVDGRIWSSDRILMRGTGLFKVIGRREGQPDR